MARKNDNPFAMVDGLEKNKPFMTISQKQAASPAFKRLTGDAAKLLVCLKISRKRYMGEDESGKSRAIDGDFLRFTWGRETAKAYGFGNPNKTLEAMRDLVRNGFVEVLENNKPIHKENVFRFSWQWQNENIVLSDASRTYIQTKPKKKRCKE